jgi:dTDP-4-amino-4,6-dideoxygalactose transaminase
MIPFNKPYLTGKELEYIADAVASGKISGNGKYTKLCHDSFEKKYGFKKCLLTTSCTDALEMAAILCDIKQGDEVIMPSYTFVSTALAFVRQGAKIVFCDSRKDYPGIDENKIEVLINDKTKAIVPVHYAGVACDMNKIMDIANRHKLLVIEDAAQAIDSFYISNDNCGQSPSEYSQSVALRSLSEVETPKMDQGVCDGNNTDCHSELSPDIYRQRRSEESDNEKFPLGSIGHFGCFSFHETKNIQCGEGGLLVINDERFAKRAEIIWEKGTNRAEFFRGEVNKYGWVDIGSSFLPSDVLAAFLYAQLENIDDIQEKRKYIWQKYYQGLKPLEEKGLIQLPIIPNYATNNAHNFYIKCKSLIERTELIAFLKDNEISAVFHYLSLHKSDFYKDKHDGRNLPECDKYADCLLRLPMFYELGEEEMDIVINKIKLFFK